MRRNSQDLLGRWCCGSCNITGWVSQLVLVCPRTKSGRRRISTGDSSYTYTCTLPNTCRVTVSSSRFWPCSEGALTSQRYFPASFLVTFLIRILKSIISARSLKSPLEKEDNNTSDDASNFPCNTFLKSFHSIAKAFSYYASNILSFKT